MHLARPETTDARVVALQAARARLRERGIPTVELVPAPDGAVWTRIDDRVVEVERWIEHDGRMNTWPTLAEGAALLARVHDAWACLAHALPRLHAWGAHALADDVRRLADLTAEDTRLPTQIVHGDFWDDNVYLRAGEIVAVTDFDFLGRAPRIDDLALTLHFADEQPAFEGIAHRPAGIRRAELVTLVSAYAAATQHPFADDEWRPLPRAFARQPLWRYAKWLAIDPDDVRARQDALETAPAVSRALEVMAEKHVWVDAFADATAVRPAIKDADLVD